MCSWSHSVVFQPLHHEIFVWTSHFQAPSPTPNPRTNNQMVPFSCKVNTQWILGEWRKRGTICPSWKVGVCQSLKISNAQVPSLLLEGNPVVTAKLHTVIDTKSMKLLSQGPLMLLSLNHILPRCPLPHINTISWHSLVHSEDIRGQGPILLTIATRFLMPY